VAAYGLNNGSVGRVAGRAGGNARLFLKARRYTSAPGRAAGGLRQDSVPQAKSLTSRLWRFTA
jgi:hypothetical protein